MERETVEKWADIQPELDNVCADSTPISNVCNCDDGDFTTEPSPNIESNESLTAELSSSSVVNLTKKAKQKPRRRPRKHKPGKRKAKKNFHRLKNRRNFRRHIIPRSSLGAPFLCNDMLMAKDGFVFDTFSGKIEFKPDIVLGLSENPSVLDVPRRMSPSNSYQSRYVPISPYHEHQSDLDGNSPVRDDEMCLDLNNNNIEEIHSQLQVSNASPSSDFGSGTSGSPDTDLFGSNVDFKDEQELSLYFDDEQDFQFHLKNFEEDTERYLRSSLMELSRESLEAEYYSKMKQLRSLQFHKGHVEDLLTSSELKHPSSTLGSNVPLSDQLKQLSQLATTVSSQLEKLQQENDNLREENDRLKTALDT